jgi:hypothetical protein
MTFLKGLAAVSGTVLALLIATIVCFFLQTPLDFDDTLTDLLAGGSDLARPVYLGLSALGIQPLKV